MRRGPLPKNTAQRKREGNPSGRPYNPNEPQIPTVGEEAEAPPALIADDAVAADEWIRLAPILRRARVLTAADTNALAAYCQQWSVYQDALVKAPPATRVFKSPNDYPCINPYLSIANKALMMCIRLGEQLGLSPGGRSRVSAAPSADDPFAEFDGPALPTTAAPLDFDEDAPGRGDKPTH
jgi:P27 family predicted phage terminase small subunit